MTTTDQPLWINGEQYHGAERFGFTPAGGFMMELHVVPPSEGGTPQLELCMLTITTFALRSTTVGETGARVTADAPHRITIYDDFGEPHEVAGETGFIARLIAECRANGLVGPERAIRKFGDYRTEMKYVAGPGAELFRILSPRAVGPWARSAGMAWRGYKAKRRGRPLPHEALIRRELTKV